MAIGLKKKFEENRAAAEAARAAQPSGERRHTNPRAIEIVGNETIIELREQLELAKDRAVQNIDPTRARPSVFMNRHPSAFETEEFLELVEDIRATGGNTVPAVVRRLAGDPSHDFEIIAGLRRHAASIRAGTPLKVYVEKLDDRQAFETMTRENAKRKDLSPWEWGRHYDAGLRIYQTQKELAATNGMSHAHVSRSLAVFRLPDEVVGAFASPGEIQFEWATPLEKAMERAGEKVRRAALEIARQDKRPTAVEVLKALLDAGRGAGRPAGKRKAAGIRRSIQIGKAKGTLWSQGGKTGFELKADLPAEKLDALERFLKTLLA